jgi:putative membrane protein
MDMLLGSYLWLKAAHVVFMVFWMAGMFIFPRYLVHHQEALAGGHAREAAAWVEREATLRRVILTPALLAVVALGVLLATVGQHWSSGWLHAKLLFVVLLTGYHGWAVGYSRKLAAARPTLSDRTLRLVNELPAVALIAIVVLAVVKPF